MANGPYNCYLDIPTLQGWPQGFPITDLVGGNTVLTVQANAGATALTVSASAGFQPNQPVYVLDGPNSEIAFAAASNTTPNGTTLNLNTPGLQFPHSSNVSVSSPGPSGALGQILLGVSGWIENYCKQGTMLDRGLFSKSHTEKLEMPTTRATLDANWSLVVAPRYFPITVITSLSIEQVAGQAVGLDVTQMELATVAKWLTVPLMQPVPGSQQQQVVGGWTQGPPLLRGDQGWVNLVYTAGVTWGSMPWDLTQAALWAAQESLAMRQNPTGAATIRQGDTQTVQRQRGRDNDRTADSIYFIQARELLQPYRAIFV